MKLPALPALLASLVLASFAASGPSLSNELPPSFDDSPSIVDAPAKARGTAKPVIVYLTEQNCPVCDALDGWLVRGDVRQAFAPAYHFAMVFADDMVAGERERWRATYSPRGAPAWVVLAPDGSYVCTASGGFANATAALELHKVLARATARAGEPSKLALMPPRPRNCSPQALGL